jgi:hypothetical protein
MYENLTLNMSEYQEYNSLPHLFLSLHTSLCDIIFNTFLFSDYITNSVATETESS